MKEIIIKAQAYPIKFGLSVIRRFSAKMGFKTVNEFQKFIESMGEELTFDQMEGISLLMLMAIERGGEDAGVSVKLTSDDILDLFAEDQSIITAMMKTMTETFAQGESKPETKKKAANKQSAGKR